MNPNDYIEAVGKIIVNLQSLEFLLRAFLYNNQNQPHNPIQPGGDFYNFQIGDVVPENAFTSYDSLGQLIARYNNHIKQTNSDLQVDGTIVELRDAFAHGRISDPDTDDIFSLVKFSRPQQGQITVTYLARMTREWLTRENLRVITELEKVRKAANASFTPFQ